MNVDNNVPRGQIVALGGGGFSTEPENSLLDEFVLSLVPQDLPKICFVPTASAESVAYIVRFYRAFSGRALPTDLTIFDPSSLPRQPARTSEIAAFFAQQDIIYVGGGSTANMLSVWRMHGLDHVLRELWERGIVLCGVSAGMLCWFNGGVTDSFGGLEYLADGLGFIDATACPHYDGGAERRAAYHRIVEGGTQGGYAADDGVALHFRGREFVEAVSSRPDASGYRVDFRNGGVAERRLETRYLGASGLDGAHNDR